MPASAAAGRASATRSDDAQRSRSRGRAVILGTEYPAISYRSPGQCSGCRVFDRSDCRNRCTVPVVCCPYPSRPEPEVRTRLSPASSQRRTRSRFNVPLMSKRSRCRWPTVPLDRCSADDCSTIFHEGKGSNGGRRQELHGRGPEGSAWRPRLDAATNFGGPALVNVKIDKGSAREGKSSAGTVDRLTSPQQGRATTGAAPDH